MRSDEIETARREMLLWSVPIIADCLAERYASLLGGNSHTARALTSTHARMWRALLQGDATRREEASMELTKLARLAGLATRAVEEVNQAMLEEMLEVVTERFTRSPRLVRDNTRLLLTASTQLVEMRLAVAG